MRAAGRCRGSIKPLTGHIVDVGTYYAGADRRRGRTNPRARDPPERVEIFFFFLKIAHGDFRGVLRGRTAARRPLPRAAAGYGGIDGRAGGMRRQDSVSENVQSGEVQYDAILADPCRSATVGSVGAQRHRDIKHHRCARAVAAGSLHVRTWRWSDHLMEERGHGSGHLWLWIVTAGLVYGDRACSFDDGGDVHVPGQPCDGRG